MNELAKSDCEKLMNFLVVYVEKFLLDAGEFFPVGAILENDGAMRSFAGYDGRENPPSQDIIAIIRDGFIEAARGLRTNATALAYDVLITDPVNGVRHDAIAIELDHRESYSVVVYFRYRLVNQQMILENPTTEQGAGRIFV